MGLLLIFTKCSKLRHALITLFVPDKKPLLGMWDENRSSDAT